MLNKADWADWLHHPVTRHYLDLLTEELEGVSECRYDPESVEKTALDSAYRTGLAHGLEIAKTLEPEFTDGSEGSDS